MCRPTLIESFPPYTLLLSKEIARFQYHNMAVVWAAKNNIVHGSHDNLVTYCMQTLAKDHRSAIHPAKYATHVYGGNFAIPKWRS